MYAFIEQHLLMMNRHYKLYLTYTDLPTSSVLILSPMYQHSKHIHPEMCM